MSKPHSEDWWAVQVKRSSGRARYAQYPFVTGEGRMIRVFAWLGEAQKVARQRGGRAVRVRITTLPDRRQKR